MKQEPFVIERTYQAPVDRVWRAITDRDQMKQWYFDIAAFKPEVGFEFQFSAGNEGKIYVHLCKVTEVILGKKLKYSWQYEGHEGLSYVTFELFPEGDKTRLKLTHEGLETFPDTPEFKRKNFEEGWTALIGDLLPKFLS
ncbi:MAG: SRPBCC domain-containing protein [Chitinophagaceae bacterium]|nr:SRPBCC domain-containing protein [Chitinophagaceae bacterium]